jgi:hypothetical protein
MIPKLNDTQARGLARLLKPLIEEFMNSPEYISCLEELKDNDPEAAKELAEIKAKSGQPP